MSIQSLRNLLNENLHPTGNDGFEGLISRVLCDITGLPFRLAASGLQSGSDGTTAGGDQRIRFECKLYRHPVRRAEVMSKIGELAAHHDPPALWVLCATSEISQQIADRVDDFAQRSPVSTLILDWPDTGLPLLSTALAMAKETVGAFISDRRGPVLAKEALAALNTVAEDPDFASQAERLRKVLADPTTGLEAARAASNKWMEDAFSDKDRALECFGQPLSPAATIVNNRDSIVGKVRTFLSGDVDTSIGFIAGPEGVGKSWIVAQSWLSQETRPMMLIISPNMFADTAEELDFEKTLIAALIAQTGVPLRRDSLERKWRGIFSAWRSRTCTAIRLVVVIDGINQRPRKDWARILDRFGAELYSIGGQLIVTVREPYFRNRVVPRLVRPYREIPIPEWTEGERDALLMRHNIAGADLAPKVAAALLNPRVLGIAIQIWERADISSLADLSVSRLLFEHIRASERDAPTQTPATETIRTIRDHAEKILRRLPRGLDDLAVFEGQVESVVEGRFFHTVEDDQGRYELTEDGLPLALAFLAVDRMRQALRNGRDPADEIRALVDPIAPLDVTADVFIAAITLTCVDDGSYSDQMRVALIEEFGRLQNSSSDCRNQLVYLASREPEAFSEAVCNMCLRGGMQANLDLITEALRGAVGRSDDAWRTVSRHVHGWLTYYNLDSGPFPRWVGQADRDLRDRATKFKERVDDLSITEQQSFGRFSVSEGDLFTLFGLAFVLLSSAPRASVAGSLVRWTLATVLLSDYPFYHDQIVPLIRYNKIDWCETRAALLREIEKFRSDEVSRSGKWTLVYILRATGDVDDAREASELMKRLGFRAGWSWRLVDDLCAEDPCDPQAKRPDNITKTAQRYEAIPFDNLSTDEHPASRDVIFDKARPAMVRFEWPGAVTKHLEYATAVTTDERRHHDLVDLRSHNALLQDTHLSNLDRGTALGTPSPHRDNPEGWRSGQFRLLLKFPFLDGSAQVDALTIADTEPILELIDNLHAMDGDTFCSRLEAAHRSNNEAAQFALLLVGSSTDTPIKSEAKTVIVHLLESASARVRAQAMGVVARLGSVDLLRNVACGEWQASGTKYDESTRYDEDCYGSEVLLLSVREGLTSPKDALRRMSPRYYGPAAAMWDTDGAGYVAQLVDSSIRSADGNEVDFGRPLDIEKEHRGGLRCRVSLSDEAILEPNEEGIPTFLIGDDEIRKRWKRLQKEFEDYERRVRAKGCFAVLDFIDLDEFRSIVEADQALSDRWYELFASMSVSKLRVFFNLVLALGYSIGYHRPDRAVALFNSVRHCEPMVRVWYGDARVSISALAVWGGGDGDELDVLRCRRLDEAADDYQISQEVLAAHRRGRESLIQEYVEERLRREEPSDIARALMVAGFSDRSKFNDAVLGKYRDAHGFLGEVCGAATYAYERNSWARHWFDKMCNANDRTEFWRYSVLFQKVVDGRLDLWLSESECVDQSDPMRRFWPNLRHAVRRRMNRWKAHRARKLFGAAIPKEWFLPPPK